MPIPKAARYILRGLLIILPPAAEASRGKQLLFNRNCQTRYSPWKKDWYVDLEFVFFALSLDQWIPKDNWTSKRFASQTKDNLRPTKKTEVIVLQRIENSQCCSREARMKEKYTWKQLSLATKLSNPVRGAREELSASLPPANLRLSSPGPFMRNHFWLCRDVGITIFLSLPPSLPPYHSLLLFFENLHCSVRGRDNEDWEGERDDREDRQRGNEGSCSLCTSLIQHCRGTVFYFRLAEEARHDAAARRYIKRRVLFCKCAPGNWSSCCSSFGLFVCHFNQEPSQEGSPGVQSVQAGNADDTENVDERKGFCSSISSVICALLCIVVEQGNN